MRYVLFAVTTLSLVATGACGPKEVDRSSGGAAGSGPGPAAQMARRVDIARVVPSGWKHDMGKKPVTGRKGMVSTDDAQATEVGRRILSERGNAVDAAVATAFALAVTYPQAGNIGGGGFAVVHGPKKGSAALDFREKAPAEASSDMYVDAISGDVTEDSRVGALAAGVPGTVAGLWKLHDRFGSMPWTKVVEPAIRLAREGFEVDAALAKSFQGARGRLERFESTRQLYMPDGTLPKAGETWTNEALADVLERIADEGPEGFYEGETAEGIVAQMEAEDGILGAEDLADYEAEWRDPVTFDYAGHRIVSMPPPSSGGLVMALMANLLPADDLRARGWHGAEALHLLTEGLRRSFALRNAHLGDPDFVEIPTRTFRSEESAEKLRDSIRADSATPSEELSIGVGQDEGGQHTTHVSVVDRKGRAVALTTTLNFAFGSALAVEGAGFVLNNEMDDFTAQPGEPNAYGLVQGEANAIAPGKRMLSSMSPTIALGPEEDVRVVTGAAGGPAIITAVHQILLNRLVWGLGPVASVAAPRLHHQHLPDKLFYEKGGLLEETVGALRALGHDAAASERNLGDAPSIFRTDRGWAGVVEPRQQGAAAAAP